MVRTNYNERGEVEFVLGRNDVIRLLTYLERDLEEAVEKERKILVQASAREKISERTANTLRIATEQRIVLESIVNEGRKIRRI